MNRSRLFAASRVALVVTSMSFALRGAAMAPWEKQFHLTHAELGWIDGTAFWGFTLAMLFGGPFCDVLGLKRFLGIAFIGHLAGIVLTITAHTYASLYCATLVFGIANGTVEAACNPLITTLYPEDKTTRLNEFHVWFPGGIVVGGLWAYAATALHWGWPVQFAAMLLPLMVYGWLFWAQEFPVTERVQRGISSKDMFLGCVQPGFLIMAFCMFLTAATEFGPSQWIPVILTNAGVSGILVLVWITGLMAVGRQSAGAIVHRLPPLAILLCSAILSGLGLYIMSRSSGGMLFVAATVFAAGVCFFWPTMLGYVSERFPVTGALGLAIMGGAGMLSASVVLPVIGQVFDKQVALTLPPGTALSDLVAAQPDTPLGGEWISIQAAAGLHTLARVTVLPAALAVIFSFLLVLQLRRNGGGASTRKPSPS